MPLARIVWRSRDVRVTVVPLVLAAALVGLSLPDPAAAQRVVRLEGRVLWVAGTTLSLAVNDGPAVGVDLRNVPQGDYSGLAQGDWVVVVAQLSPDYRRLIGTSITRTGGYQAP
jgi:hypothetical protein